MKYICPLIVVDDIEVSGNFYEKVPHQQVKYDFGENVTFEGDFAIHFKSHFGDLIHANYNDILRKSNYSELYFEEDDLEGFLARLQEMDSIEYIHGITEQPWGQRVIRFYDPDKHIIEVGESLESVAKRFLTKGLTVEETANRISMSVEFVKECLRKRGNHMEYRGTYKASPQGYVEAVEGIYRKTLVWGDKSLLTEFKLTGGKKLPLHKHDEEQVGYLVSGHIILQIGTEKHDMLPGDSWAIPGGIEHAAEIMEDSVAIEVFSPVRSDYI